MLQRFLNWHTAQRVVRVMWLPLLGGIVLFFEKDKPASSAKVGYNCFIRTVLQCFHNLPQFTQELSAYAKDRRAPHAVTTYIKALNDMREGNDLTQSQLLAVWKAVLKDIPLVYEADPPYDAAYFLPEFISYAPEDMLRIYDKYLGIEMKYTKFHSQHEHGFETYAEHKPMLWMTPDDDISLANVLDVCFGYTYTQDMTPAETQSLSRMPFYLAIGFCPPEMPVKGVHVPETLTLVRINDTSSPGIKALDPEKQPAYKQYELIAIASYKGPCHTFSPYEYEEDEELYGYDSYVKCNDKWWKTQDVHHFLSRKSIIAPEEPPAFWKSRTSGLPFLMFYQDVTPTTCKNIR